MKQAFVRLNVGMLNVWNVLVIFVFPIFMKPGLMYWCLGFILSISFQAFKTEQSILGSLDLTNEFCKASCLNTESFERLGDPRFSHELTKCWSCNLFPIGFEVSRQF